MRRSWMLLTPAALLGVTAVAVLLAVAVVPGAARQVALSTTRQPTPFVELYFGPHGDASCPARAGRLRVGFTVVSHLASPRRLAYTVGVRTAAGRESHRTGEIRLAPGRRTHVERVLRVRGARPSEVVVRLPARDQEIRLRCTAPRAGR